MKTIFISVCDQDIRIYDDYELEETIDTYIITGKVLGKSVVGTFPKMLTSIEEWPEGEPSDRNTCSVHVLKKK